MSSGAAAASLLEPVPSAALPGWREHDHAGAMDAFRLSCREILDQGTGFSRSVRFGGSRASWLAACDKAFGASDARRFFETSFRAFRVKDRERPEGLFTGYFEPEVLSRDSQIG